MIMLQRIKSAYPAESLRSRLMRYVVNLTPVFRATGAWITFISADMRLVKLRLPLKLKTKNLMGTMCGAIYTVLCTAFTPSC